MVIGYELADEVEGIDGGPEDEGSEEGFEDEEGGTDGRAAREVLEFFHGN